MNLVSDGALVQSAILLQEYALIAADRAALPMHPAIAGGYLGMGNESQTVTRQLAGLGTAEAATISESGEVVATDIGFSSYSATVVRKSLGRRYSDMLKFYDRTGVIKDPAGLAFDAMATRSNTLLTMVAAAAATASTGVSVTSGTALTYAKFVEAKQSLVESGQDFAPGSLLAILHPKQWNNIETEMIGTGLGDAVTHSDAAQSIQIAQAIGYQGRYLGIDVFTTSRVATANSGADSKGVLIAPGGVAWAEGEIEPDPDGFMDILDGGRLQIERQRDASRMLKSVFYNFLVGVSLGEDARVRTITSDR